MLVWMELAFRFRIPIYRLKKELTHNQFLIHVEYLRMEKLEQYRALTRDDWLTARICLEIDRLRHSMSGKKGRRFRGKLKDYMLKWSIKGEKEAPRKLTKEEYDKEKKKAALKAKRRWFPMLGIPMRLAYD